MRFCMTLLAVMFAVAAVAGEPAQVDKRKVRTREVLNLIEECTNSINFLTHNIKIHKKMKDEGDPREEYDKRVELLKQNEVLLVELKLKLAYLKGETTVKDLENRVKAAQNVVDAAVAEIAKMEASLKQAQEIAAKEGAYQYQKDAVVRVQAELAVLQAKKVEPDKVLAQTKKDLDAIKKLEAELAPPAKVPSDF